jgi:hypothetical protein
MNMPFLSRLIFFLCLTLLLSFRQVDAAEPEKHSQIIKANTESAFIGGIGTGNIPEGHYQPVLLIWHLGIDMKKYFPWLGKHRGSLSGFLETQFNPAVNPNDNFEFGINPGIQYRYPFTEKLAGYLLVSSGPHYISLVTARQANGFIFSDAIGGGFYYSLGGNSAVTLGYRWRHLSNASLEMPNDGINTHFITFGYAVFF